MSRFSTSTCIKQPQSSGSSTYTRPRYPDRSYGLHCLRCKTKTVHTIPKYVFAKALSMWLRRHWEGNLV